MQPSTTPPADGPPPQLVQKRIELDLRMQELDRKRMELTSQYNALTREYHAWNDEVATYRERQTAKRRRPDESKQDKAVTGVWLAALTLFTLGYVVRGLLS